MLTDSLQHLPRADRLANRRPNKMHYLKLQFSSGVDIILRHKYCVVSLGFLGLFHFIYPAPTPGHNFTSITIIYNQYNCNINPILSA